MFSEELRKLIEASLVDGVITDQERAVIRKRALLEGVDPDEVDLMLDAEIQKLKKKQQEAIAKVTKCPACGEIIPTLTAICPACGHVINASNSESKELLIFMDTLEKALKRLKGTGALLYNSKARTELEGMIRQGKALYGDNRKVNGLISDIESSIDKFEKKHKRIVRLFWIILIAIVVIPSSIYLYITVNDNAVKESCLKEATHQCDSLCLLLNKIEVPNSSNYKEVEKELMHVKWIDPVFSVSNYKIEWEIEKNIDKIKATYLEKKRSIASQIFTVYKEVYPGKVPWNKYGEDWAKNQAPDFISYPELYIEN